MLNPNIPKIINLLGSNKKGMHTKQIAKVLNMDYRIIGILCSTLEDSGILEGTLRKITWEGREYGARIYKLKPDDLSSALIKKVIN